MKESKFTHQDLCLQACKEAGEKILEVYNREFQIEIKGDNSPLTEADEKSHQVIQKYLEKTGIPVLSEEGRDIPAAERMLWKELWVVDPLDGTKEFIKKNGEFTVNIARVVNGKAVEGYVYAPVLDILYAGEEGKGAWAYKAFSKSTSFNQENCETLPMVSHETYGVVASRSHLSPETSEYIEELKKQHGDIETKSMGSSLKICMIATGEANIYPRFAPTMEWDTAAGHAVVKAAEKNMFVYPGEMQELAYNKIDLKNPWFVAK